MLNLAQFYTDLGVKTTPQPTSHLLIGNAYRVQVSEARVLILCEAATVHDKGLVWLRAQNAYSNLIVMSTRSRHIGLLFFYHNEEDETAMAVKQVKEIIY